MRRSLVLLVPFAFFAACGGDYEEDPSAADAGTDAAADGPRPVGHADGSADPGARDAGDASLDAGVTTLAVDDVSLRDGMEVSVSVVVTRPAGDAAPLGVTLEGLPPDVQATPSTVNLGASDTVATFKLTRGVGAAAGNVTLTARATSKAGASTTFTLHVVAGGDIDPTFGKNGVVTLPSADQTAFGPDGSLYLIRLGVTGCSVEKRRPNGELDTQYGTDGKATTAPGVAALTIDQARVAPQGDLVIGAEERDGDSRPVIFRFSSAGVFDTTFAGTGFITIPKAPNGTRLRAVAVRPTGETVVAYTAYSGSIVKPTLAQFLANGQPDPAFVDPTPETLADYGVLRLLPGGDTLAAGTTTSSESSVMRFGRERTLQTASKWGTAFAAISTLETLPDGSVFAAGFASSTGNFKGSSFAAAKYDPSLQIVSPFTSAWSKRIGTDANRADTLSETALDSRQRLIAVGISDLKRFVVGRFTGSGFDPGFGVGGIANPVSGQSVFPGDVVILPSGVIAVSVRVEDDNSTRLLHLLP